jgi:hypothetical protein
MNRYLLKLFPQRGPGPSILDAEFASDSRAIEFAIARLSQSVKSAAIEIWREDGLPRRIGRYEPGGLRRD